MDPCITKNVGNLCLNFTSTHGIFSMFSLPDTQHQFNARESDWGFTSFMPLSELYDPARGYLMHDTLIVEAEVIVRRVVDYWTYDSKKRLVMLVSRTKERHVI